MKSFLLFALAILTLSVHSIAQNVEDEIALMQAEFGMEKRVMVE